MGRSFRFVATALVAWSCWSLPLSTQARAVVQYSARTDTHIPGILSDRSNGVSLSFSAANEGGLTTLQIDLDRQSITLRKRANELHISSSLNRGREFATLSEGEKQVIRDAVAIIDEDVQDTNGFYTEVACMMRQFGGWPSSMPLLVSKDHLQTTVGDVSVANKDIETARRQAMARAFPDGPPQPPVAAAIVSFCNVIGRARSACYPTSLIPYREKCENVLVGGLVCRGRCGTTCNGLCKDQRYTLDWFNHDRCADVWGLTHRYCNFIFPAAFDDCTKAPTCTDSPGVWTLRYTWKGFRPGTARWNVFPTPGKTFRDNFGGSGKWAVAGATMKLGYSNGCKPVYTGTLNTARTGLVSGTMRCLSGSGSGTWSATKTNGILPPGSDLPDEPSLPAPGAGSPSGPTS